MTRVDPLSVYIPIESLTERDVYSIITVATSNRRESLDYSKRTLLIFLLAINQKLTEFEKQTDQNKIQRAEIIRQWLVDKNKQPLDWNKLQEKYDTISNNQCDELAHFYEAEHPKPYFELEIKVPYADIRRSREYIKKFRKDGFNPDELKVYWNAEQIENLCQHREDLSHDPSDKDAIENLKKHPVSDRNHSGHITYVNKGIERAVFDVPEDAQIIVLNFANEQSPGGGYLRHALAQEEVLLYNSDGYRALLDLKYGRMGGGYAIPEFGLTYVRNMRVFDSETEKEPRQVDMLVSACYCLNGQELYPNPRTWKEWEEKNLAKFRAFMAAAVANTIGNGKNTYLLLGPIGTGAFGNDVEQIGKVFREVLDMKMMNSNGPIRFAFDNIWFVSIDDWKNDKFKEILLKNEIDNIDNK